MTDEMLTELKACFMEAYDDNQDGKIDIREVRILIYNRLILKSFTQHSLQLAQLLPMEENFLLLFRFDNPLESSVEFMKVSSNKTF